MKISGSIGFRGLLFALLVGGGALAAAACGGERVVEKVVKETVVVVATPTPGGAAAPRATPTSAPAGPIVLPASKSPSGTVVMALLGSFLGGSPGSLPDLGIFPARPLGAGESLFVPSEATWETPMLAESWEVSSDLSSMTVKIRKGVRFHKDWGELTAADMAWVINRTNPLINPESIAWSAANLSSLFGSDPVEAVDANTIRGKFSNFDVRWASNILNQVASGGLTTIATSKKAFDERGRDYLKDNFIGTGPFQVIEHKVDLSGVYEKVPYDHWRKNASIKQLRVVAVPEEATRVAMLQTGEADVAYIDPKDHARLRRLGFVAMSAGNGVQEGVMFPGNLWETTNALTGVKIDHAQHGVFARELPWIGNPFSPSDSNNPAGMTDMEQARLVRQAMARSVDRDAIIEHVLGGVGIPVHVDYYSIKNPYWDSKYEYPYDVAAAEKMLDDAGFPKGSNGVRFEIPLFVGPELGGGEGPAGEIGDAIAGFWEKVGIKTSVLKYAYAVFRPGLVGRSTVTPMLTSCDDGQEAYPFDWPKGLVMTTLTRGGFSCGFESPEILAWYQEAAGNPDINRRIAINTELLAYLHNWALFPGYVSIPNALFANPNYIGNWDMHPDVGEFNSPENIVLK